MQVRSRDRAAADLRGAFDDVVALGIAGVSRISNERSACRGLAWREWNSAFQVH